MFIEQENAKAKNKKLRDEVLTAMSDIRKLYDETDKIHVNGLLPFTCSDKLDKVTDLLCQINSLYGEVLGIIFYDANWNGEL